MLKLLALFNIRTRWIFQCLPSPCTAHRLGNYLPERDSWVSWALLSFAQTRYKQFAPSTRIVNIMHSSRRKWISTHPNKWRPTLSHGARPSWHMEHEVKTRGTWHEDAHAWQVHHPRQSAGCPGGLTLAKYRNSGQRRLENTPRGDRHSWPGSSASAGVYSLHSSGWLIRQFWRQRSKVGGAGSWADTAAKWNWIGRK